MATVPMFAPDGTLGDIPAEKLHDALAQGFKQGVTMKAADGKLGVIPADRALEASKSGLQIVPLGDQETQHPGFWKSLGGDLMQMAKGLPQAAAQYVPAISMLQESLPSSVQKAMGFTPAVERIQSLRSNSIQRGVEGRSLPYRVGAAVNEMLGVNVRGEEQSAQQGDVAGVAGHAAAVPVVMAAGAGIGKVAPKLITPLERAALLGKTPEGAYESALKPRTTIPPEKVAAMVQTGLENKIPVTPGGVEKLGALVDDLNAKIKNVIASDPNRPINKFAVASRLGKTAQTFATQVNPASDLAAISESGNEFLAGQPGEIPAAQAQAMKQGTYRQLSSKYGEMKSAAVESQKALARGLKEEIANQFPEINGLNAAESRLLNLQPVLEKAVQRISNHQLIGIGTPVVTGAAKAVTGSNAAAATAGVLKAVLDNPGVKSRLAIAISKGGKIPPAIAATRLAAYSAALAANSEAPENQTSQ